MAGRLALSLISAFTLGTSASPLGASTSPVIIGGEDAKSGDFPYIVALLRDDKILCGGSLLNADTVLSAAHCVDIPWHGVEPGSQLAIRAGSLKGVSGGVKIAVANITIHPDRNPYAFHHDLVIFKLSSPVLADGTMGDSKIGYATLPSANSEAINDTPVEAAGWGRTTSKVDPFGGGLTGPLKKIGMSAIDRETCKAIPIVKGEAEVTEDMICAKAPKKSEAPCKGDSGGPVQEKASGVLIGVTSWVPGRCVKESPTVFARVSSELDWINSFL